jgi:Fe-S-cluster containining protein
MLKVGRKIQFKRHSTMPIEKAIIRTLEGKEIAVTEQIPIPCFRCGVCCTRYTPPLTSQEIDNIASALGISRSKCLSKYSVKAPVKEGYLLKRTDKGCVFLAWDADGKARCIIHPSRPQACREWTPSLAKPECREGLAKLKSQGQIMLLDELFPSQEQQKELYRSLRKASHQP